MSSQIEFKEVEDLFFKHINHKWMVTPEGLFNIEMIGRRRVSPIDENPYINFEPADDTPYVCTPLFLTDFYIEPRGGSFGTSVKYFDLIRKEWMEEMHQIPRSTSKENSVIVFSFDWFKAKGIWVDQIYLANHYIIDCMSILIRKSLRKQQDLITKKEG